MGYSPFPKRQQLAARSPGDATAAAQIGHLERYLDAVRIAAALGTRPSAAGGATPCLPLLLLQLLLQLQLLLLLSLDAHIATARNLVVLTTRRGRPLYVASLGRHHAAANVLGGRWDVHQVLTHIFSFTKMPVPIAGTRGAVLQPDPDAAVDAHVDIGAAEERRAEGSILLLVLLLLMVLLLLVLLLLLGMLLLLRVMPLLVVVVRRRVAALVVVLLIVRMEAPRAESQRGWVLILVAEQAAAECCAEFGVPMGAI